MLDLQQAKKRMEELTALVEDYSYWYYVMDNPKVEDYEYDRLYHELLDLEEQFPELSPPIPLPQRWAERPSTPLRRSAMRCRWLPPGRVQHRGGSGLWPAG